MFTHFPLGGRICHAPVFFQNYSKTVAGSTLNLVYLILHQFDIKLPNFVEIGWNFFLEIDIFVGSLHINFDQNWLNVKKFTKTMGLKQTALKDQ